MENEILEKTINFVQNTLKNAEAGHDWFHTERVWKISEKLAAIEGGDKEIIALSALLHDIADPKFHEGDETLALKIAGDFLRENNLSEKKIEKILYIIQHLSFKNRNDTPKVGMDAPIKELRIVQDADRLDAIGAIGIARTFNFGGFKNNLMYDPNIPPNLHQTKEEYKKSKGTTINHFYEKLLLLKDLMNTKTAKKWAEERHQRMLIFLEDFYKEWRVEL